MKNRRMLFIAALSVALALIWVFGPPSTLGQTGDPLMHAFSLVEVASVADAVEQVVGQRAHMASHIQPLFPARIAGPAVTVMMRKEEHTDGSADFEGVLDAIDTAPAGSVFVLVMEDGQDIGSIGGLMGTAMKVRGLAGAVVDGGIRDTPQLRRIQFPVFGGRPVPSTSINHYRFVGANIPVMCAGVQVRPNDIIVADADGVAVVPREQAKEVLAKAEENDRTEHAMYPFIERLKSIKKAVEEYGRI